MAYRGYTFTAAGDDVTASPVLPGQLQRAIRHRFAHRPANLPIRLESVTTGKKGPWRDPHRAGVYFAPTMNAAPIGNRFIIRGVHGHVLSKVSVDAVYRGLYVAYAASMEVGTPYVFGVANGPEDPGKDAFDCSGLTQWAWATVGVPLTHSADAQRQECPATSNPEVGDLVGCWFPNSRGIEKPKWSHVGLFIDKPTRDSVLMLDTRNPHGEPVAYRVQDTSAVMGYAKPK
jgi:hypothetical protein